MRYVCHRFLVEIFTKLFHRGGVAGAGKHNTNLIILWQKQFLIISPIIWTNEKMAMLHRPSS